MTVLRTRPLDRWPREQTRVRQTSPFLRPGGWDNGRYKRDEVSYSQTLVDLERELDALRVREAVLQLAIGDGDLRLDGNLRADARPSHPGVVLTFTAPGKGVLSFACDRFERWQTNLRAIAKFYRIVRDLSAPSTAPSPPPEPPAPEPDAPKPRGTRVKGVRGRAWNRKPESATRVCHACKVEKPIEQFAVRTDYGTRRGTCIDCYRDGQHQRYLSVERTERLRTVLRFILDGEDDCAHLRCSICTKRFRAGDEVAAFDLSLAHADCHAAAEGSAERETA